MGENDSWKVKTMVIGAVVGALFGAGVSYLLLQRADKEGAKPHVGPAEGIQLGLGMLGLLRLVNDWVKPKELHR
jgi:hypothetical protein